MQRAQPGANMDVRSNAPSKRRRISTSSQMEHVQRTVRTEESPELREPSEDDGTQSFDEEGDVGVLRTWRAMCPELQETWPEDEQPEDWEGVTMEDGRVVKLVLEEFGLTGAVPAEIGRLSALRTLDLDNSSLTSLPAEIGQLTSLRELNLRDNRLTSVPAEVGQLTSLRRLDLADNQLTSVPAEIGQLTSLKELYLSGNQLTSLPAEIGQLTVAGGAGPLRQSADERAGGDRAAHVAEELQPQPQSADELARGDRAAHVAEGVVPQ